PGPLFCVLGTAEVVGAVFDSPVIDNDGLLETHGYFGDSYLVENPGWLAGGSVSWARELLGFDDDAALDRAAAEVPPGSDGLLFLPALTGAMAPRWNAGARGCFYGLTPAHGRGHLARAVLEGCALAMRDVQERMQEIGRPADSIIALGGGAASKVWLQIRADVGGLEVHGSELTDSCALGAAMLAAAAAQGRPVLELAAEIEHTRQSFEPRPELRATYDVAHRSYRQLFDRLEPLFDG
ncbi:MAG: hypothetical protein KJO07_18015, partial [Deltaproteobacteria bacterium]|nr:hypothetical protein [Deltaproteobacteria bacterium]